MQLTIDTDWQSAIYQILKQRVAGVLLTKIDAAKTFDYTYVTDASQIRIPIYDVYNALISNSVIDITKFSNDDASDIEKNLYAKFQQKQQRVFDTISTKLNAQTRQPIRMKMKKHRNICLTSVMTFLETRLELFPKMPLIHQMLLTRPGQQMKPSA